MHRRLFFQSASASPETAFSAERRDSQDIMPAKKKANTKPLTGAALVKEVCRRIRVARSYWDAHNNRACRGEREKAMALYESLSEAEREKVPQELRVWLRYRSEKYFGDERTPPGGGKW
jgi:hypothetical protein